MVVQVYFADEIIEWRSPFGESDNEKGHINIIKWDESSIYCIDENGEKETIAEFAGRILWQVKIDKSKIYDATGQYYKGFIPPTAAAFELRRAEGDTS